MKNQVAVVVLYDYLPPDPRLRTGLAELIRFYVPDQRSRPEDITLVPLPDYNDPEFVRKLAGLDFDVVLLTLTDYPRRFVIHAVQMAASTHTSRKPLIVGTDYHSRGIYLPLSDDGRTISPLRSD